MRKLHREIRLRDRSVINAFPIYDVEKKVLSVGAGQARTEWYASTIGYDVLCTDIVDNLAWSTNKFFRYEYMNIFEFNVKFKCPIVICCQVLEHMKNWKEALKNLIDLTTNRLIITIPYKNSYSSPDHKIFWDDKSVLEFVVLCKPYSVAISKIRSKAIDKQLKQWNYLIVIDKSQEI